MQQTMMTQQLQQQKAQMSGLMADLMRTLGGFAEKGPESNKRLSAAGRVTTAGLDTCSISSLLSDKLLTVLNEICTESDGFYEALIRRLKEVCLQESTENQVKDLKDETPLNSSSILKRLEEIVIASKPSQSSSRLDLDETDRVLQLSSALAAFVTTLPPSQRRHVADRIHTETVTWLSKIFRFETESGLFHCDPPDGLMEAARLSLNLRYPEYRDAGYEAFLKKGAPVVYISAAAESDVGPSFCKQLGLPPSCLYVVPRDESMTVCETMDLTQLERQVELDTENGKIPLLVAAFAGTPSLGQLDHIFLLHELCVKHNIWLHLSGNDLAMLCQLSVPINLISSAHCNSLTLNLPAWLDLPQLSCVTLFRKPQKEELAEEEDVETSEGTADQSAPDGPDPAEESLEGEGTQCETDKLLALATGVTTEGILGSYTAESRAHNKQRSASQRNKQGGPDLLTEKDTKKCESEVERMYRDCSEDSTHLGVHGVHKTHHAAECYSSRDLHKLGATADRENDEHPLRATLAETSESRCSTEAILYKCLPHWFVLQHLGQDGLAARVTHCINVIELLYSRLKKMPSIYIVKKVRKRALTNRSLIRLIYNIITAFILVEVRNPIVVFRYQPPKQLSVKPPPCDTSEKETQEKTVGLSDYLSSIEAKFKPDAFEESDTLSVDSTPAEPAAEDSSKSDACSAHDEAQESKDRNVSNYLNRLNQSIYADAETQSDMTKVHLSLVDVPELGACLRFSPLDDCRTRDATVDGIELFVSYLCAKVKEFDWLCDLHLQLYTMVEALPRLKIVSSSSWEGVGSVRYVLDEVDLQLKSEWNGTSNDAQFTDDVQKEILTLSLPHHKHLTLGVTPEGCVSIQLGTPPDGSSLQASLDCIVSVGHEAVKDVLELRKVTFEILQRIERVKADLSRRQPTDLEDMLRSSPIIGPLLSWLSPESSHPSGTSFTTSLGELKSQ